MTHNSYEQAKHALDNSQVIAFPTETVMGLGVYYDDYSALILAICNAFSEISVAITCASGKHSLR